MVSPQKRTHSYLLFLLFIARICTRRILCTGVSAKRVSTQGRHAQDIDHVEFKADGLLNGVPWDDTSGCHATVLQDLLSTERVVSGCQLLLRRAETEMNSLKENEAAEYRKTAVE